MTDVADTGTPQAIVALAPEAARAAAAAVHDIARQTGASVIPGPGAFAYPASPADALRIVRQFEHAARAEVRVHVRRAREAGLSWHEVGALLGFGELAGHGGRDERPRHGPHRAGCARRCVGRSHSHRRAGAGRPALRPARASWG